MGSYLGVAWKHFLSFPFRAFGACFPPWSRIRYPLLMASLTSSVSMHLFENMNVIISKAYLLWSFWILAYHKKAVSSGLTIQRRWRATSKPWSGRWPTRWGGSAKRRPPPPGCWRTASGCQLFRCKLQWWERWLVGTRSGDLSSLFSHEAPLLTWFIDWFDRLDWYPMHD